MTREDTHASSSHLLEDEDSDRRSLIEYPSAKPLLWYCVASATAGVLATTIALNLWARHVQMDGFYVGFGTEFVRLVRPRTSANPLSADETSSAYPAIEVFRQTFSGAPKFHETGLPFIPETSPSWRYIGSSDDIDTAWNELIEGETWYNLHCYLIRSNAIAKIVCLC